MNKQNLGIVLSVFGGSLGLLGLLGGGPVVMILVLLMYYFGIGFLLTELTDIVDSMSMWLFELLGFGDKY